MKSKFQWWNDEILSRCIYFKNRKTPISPKCLLKRNLSWGPSIYYVRKKWGQSAPLRNEVNGRPLIGMIWNTCNIYILRFWWKHGTEPIYRIIAIWGPSIGGRNCVNGTFCRVIAFKLHFKVLVTKNRHESRDKGYPIVYGFSEPPRVLVDRKTFLQWKHWYFQWFWSFSAKNLCYALKWKSVS